MRQETINIYKFNELSKEVQKKVIDNWRNQPCEYFWADEWVDSLKAFCDYFDLELKDYSVSPYSPSHVSWDFKYEYRDGETDERTHDISGDRLQSILENDYITEKLLSGNCPFTGYCFDETLLDAIRDFLKEKNHPPGYTYQDLMQDCLDNWLDSTVKDMEYQDSDEFIREELENNGYEFNEQGEMV